MYTVDDCPNIKCGYCKKCGHEECKNMGQWGKRIALYKPYFACVPSQPPICAAFEPENPHYAVFRDWEGFEDFWKAYEKAWLIDADRTRGIAVVIDGDDAIYYIPLRTWLYGKTVINGVIQATSKCYQGKRNKHGFSHLVYEKINGVNCPDEKERSK